MQAVLLWILIPGHTSASLQYQKHCTYRVFFLILYCHSSAIALTVGMQAVLLWILIPGQTSAFLELQKYRTGCPLDVALSKLYCNIDISLSARMKAVLLWILIPGHTSDFFCNYRNIGKRVLLDVVLSKLYCNRGISLAAGIQPYLWILIHSSNKLFS